MGYFYFDESIRETPGFILGAFVYSPTEMDLAVLSILAESGLTPGIDEFRSRAYAGNDAGRARLRNRVGGLLETCRVGVVVVPLDRRDTLGAEAIKCLTKLVSANELPGVHVAVFDRGVFRSQRHAEDILAASPLARRVVGHFESDSRLRAGLQLADHVAHCCARILVEHQSEKPKLVPGWEDSGYEPDDLYPLEFKLRLAIRYRWFMGEDPDPPSDLPAGWTADVANFGLLVAESCSEDLSEAAHQAFDRVYLGCVH